MSTKVGADQDLITDGFSKLGNPGWKHGLNIALYFLKMGWKKGLTAVPRHIYQAIFTLAGVANILSHINLYTP